MNRSSIISVSVTLAAFLVVAAYQTGVATAKLQDNFAPSASEIAAVPPVFRTLPIKKTGRFERQVEFKVIEDEQDAMIEWIIDCDDQFGPYAARPDAKSLESCMPS